MTPINDSTSQMVQFCLRNDTEADAKTIDIIALDRAVTLVEDYLLIPPSSSSFVPFASSRFNKNNSSDTKRIKQT
ncbi:hypothetical protein QUA54_12620 [Microcoleus sp. MOSTC5]|uniref:Uncharacterized protein n=1 Tax=Microcoleus asticus IPMA8 TaxID=2563858 RepID=A0ABX2CTQ2_9CYAN|nr:hypothetical protein [Microcoleus asticus]NQE33503.1 hypothetical protein [Microcoleus asticus IPMA8]